MKESFLTIVIQNKFVANLHELNKVPRRSHDDKIIQVMDPVHNFIDISEYPVILQLIDTPYFQRLRRLHQLGLASTVYPNATHSRFAHSIGVMHVFLALFDSVTKKSNLSKDKIAKLRPVGAVAALLHDIGHGPFSHASEKFLNKGKFNHEDLTQNIIRKTEIRSILKKNKISPQLICDVLKHEVSGDLLFVSQLISSQLDADRLDYLMRDALFTGVPYGKIDIYRIANTLSIWNKKTPKKSLKGTVVVSQKGIEAVENYLIGRYHMYKGVYYHKTIRCMESILVKIFERASTLPKEYNKITNIAKNVTPETMLFLDDQVCYSAIHKWSMSSDQILKDLSARLINRNLLKVRQINKSKIIHVKLNQMKYIEKEFKRRNFDYDYYFISDDDSKSGYDPYTATKQDDEQTAISHIMVVNEQNELEEISRISPLVRSISEESRSSVRIFYPKELSPKISSLFNNSVS